MKNASPAPWGVFCFGCACFVVGGLFAGMFGAMNAGNMFVAGLVAIGSSVGLAIAAYLMIQGNALADSAPFSTWGAGVFGFFAEVWMTLGIALLFWKDGVAGPLSFLLLFTCLVSVGYFIYSYKLKIWSFVILFTDVVIATFCAFLGLFVGWAPGATICGYLFFLLGFLALYIAFWEQLSVLLPKKEANS